MFVHFYFLRETDGWLIEVNVSLSFRNNPIYSSVVMVNKLADYIGFDIDGYPAA